MKQKVIMFKEQTIDNQNGIMVMISLYKVLYESRII